MAIRRSVVAAFACSSAVAVTTVLYLRSTTVSDSMDKRERPHLLIVHNLRAERIGGGILLSGDVKFENRDSDRVSFDAHRLRAGVEAEVYDIDTRQMFRSNLAIADCIVLTDSRRARTQKGVLADASRDTVGCTSNA